jgi:hypothetical protein
MIHRRSNPLLASTPPWATLTIIVVGRGVHIVDEAPHRRRKRQGLWVALAASGILLASVIVSRLLDRLDLPSGASAPTLTGTSKPAAEPE